MSTASPAASSATGRTERPDQPGDPSRRTGRGRHGADGGQAGTVPRGRGPHRRRVGLNLLGIPVTLIVAVELIAVCALVVAHKKVVASSIAIAVAAVIAVVALLRRRKIRVGTVLLLRLAYLFRHRETLVAATEYAGGRGPDDMGMDEIDVPPELGAFFPGMTLWESRTHDGERMGVVQWYGTCAATVRVAAPGGIVRSRNTSDNMPIEAVIGSLDVPDLGLDSVQVLTQTIVGEQDTSMTPLLLASSAELGGGRARVRNRSSFVTVRLDPTTASAAIAARGGGNVGIGRVLSAALSHVRAAAQERGLDVQVLDSVEVGRAVAESLYHQATPYDPVIRWAESARWITSTRMAHRSFAVSDVRRPTLAEIPIGNVFAYALATQAQPMADGTWSTRTVLRLTCRSTDTLGRAARDLRTAARRSGVTLRPMDAVQHLGLRATVPIGGV